MSDYCPQRRLLKRHSPKASSHALACLLTSFCLTGSAFTVAAQTPAPPPPNNETRTLQGEGKTPLSLDTRFRQIDDHYATKTAEMKQRIQEALAAIKQAPTAAEIAAVKAAIGRLEAQVTRLTAGTTRTEGALTGLTARIETVERAAKEAVTASPPPSPVLQKSETPQSTLDSAEAGFSQALAMLNGPGVETEPIRRWLELHPTHPRAAEGYFQLGLQFLNRRYPVAAVYYFKHVITDYPMSLQAKEAEAFLVNIPSVDAPKPQVSPKKMIKPSRAAGHKPTTGGPSPTTPAITPPEQTAPPAIEKDTKTPAAPTALLAPSQGSSLPSVVLPSAPRNMTPPPIATSQPQSKGKAEETRISPPLTPLTEVPNARTP